MSNSSNNLKNTLKARQDDSEGITAFCKRVNKRLEEMTPLQHQAIQDKQSLKISSRQFQIEKEFKGIQTRGIFQEQDDQSLSKSLSNLSKHPFDRQQEKQFGCLGLAGTATDILKDLKGFPSLYSKELGGIHSTFITGLFSQDRADIFARNGLNWQDDPISGVARAYSGSMDYAITTRQDYSIKGGFARALNAIGGIFQEQDDQSLSKSLSNLSKHLFDRQQEKQFGFIELGGIYSTFTTGLIPNKFSLQSFSEVISLQNQTMQDKQSLLISSLPSSNESLFEIGFMKNRTIEDIIPYHLKINKKYDYNHSENAVKNTQECLTILLKSNNLYVLLTAEYIVTIIKEVGTNGYNKIAHILLEKFECCLRYFISKRMEQSYGKQWERCHTNGLHTSWKKKQEADNKNYPLIHYADFTDYRTIMEHKNNWEMFKEFFESKESMQESLRRLYRSRNAECHRRNFDENDILEIFVEIKRIMRNIDSAYYH